MRVAFVVPGGFERPGRAGPSRSIPALNSLVERLARAHEMHVFCTDFDARPGQWTAHGAAVHDPGRAPLSALPGARTIERARRLRAAMAAAGRFDLVHAFWLDGNGVAAAWASRTLRLPLVASVGGGECVWLPALGYGNAGTVAGRAMTRLLLSQARTVTVGSVEARALVPARRVEVLPLGADRAVFDGEPEHAPEPPWRLAAVGHRNAVKDPWTMLATLAALCERGLDVHLDWVGSDTMAGAVEARADALGLRDRVTFHGQLSPAEVAAVLRRAHLHLLTSRYESQCVAVLEAALAGVPTVGTRVGLLAQLAPHAALAVPVGDANALAASVRAVLADGALRERLGCAARRWAREHDVEWTAQRFAALYRAAR